MIVIHCTREDLEAAYKEFVYRLRILEEYIKNPTIPLNSFTEAHANFKEAQEKFELLLGL